jgi:glyoxylase-like metal-dependent hydrolase (beta-lactamase superfamily II)
MKLTDRVYLVGGSGYGISPTGDCNVYIVDGGSKLALIDTGGGNGVNHILNNIKRSELNPNKIDTALITHCHYDHIGGNNEFKKLTGCKIAAHEYDVESITTLNELSLYEMGKMNGLNFKSEKVDLSLKDGDYIDLGEISLQVIHNPGHTPGCISFFFEENGKKNLLCGDIAGASGRLGFINGPGFVLSDWKKSIKKLISLNPDMMFPGHNTFLLDEAIEHLKIYDQKMNAPWINIVTSVG